MQAPSAEDAELDQLLNMFLATTNGWQGAAGCSGPDMLQLQAAHQQQLQAGLGMPPSHLAQAEGSFTGPSSSYTPVPAQAPCPASAAGAGAGAAQQQHLLALSLQQQQQLSHDAVLAELRQQQQQQHGQQQYGPQHSNGSMSWGPTATHMYSLPAGAAPTAQQPPNLAASAAAALAAAGEGCHVDGLPAATAGYQQAEQQQQQQQALALQQQQQALVLQQQQALAMLSHGSYLPPAAASAAAAAAAAAVGPACIPAAMSAPLAAAPMALQQQQQQLMAAYQQHQQQQQSDMLPDLQGRPAAAAAAAAAAPRAVAAAAAPTAGKKRGRTAASKGAGGGGGGQKKGRTAAATHEAAAAAAAAASILPQQQLEDGSVRVSARRRTGSKPGGGSSDGDVGGVSRQTITAADGPAWQLHWGQVGSRASSSDGRDGGDDAAAGAAAAAAAAAAAVAAAAGGDLGVGDESDEDAGLTTQEKNRSAQRRFRQRQKEKMSALEASNARLTAALAAAGCENRSLKHMNNALERALVLRDEHIAGLQEALRIFSPQGIGSSSTAATATAVPPQPTSSLLAAATAAPKDDSGDGTATAAAAAADKASEAAAAAAAAEGPAARAASEVCSRPAAATAATEQQKDCHPAAAAAAAAGDMAAAAAAAAAAPGGFAQVVKDALAPDFKPLTQDRGYTAEVVAGMTPTDVVVEYASLVSKVRQGLAQLEQPDAHPDVLKGVDVTMRQIGALCERVAFYKPRAIRHLVLTHLESHQRAEVDTAHWRAVVPSLFLSEQQVSDLLSARSRFISDVGGLLQSRARVRDLITASLEAAHATHIDVLSASLSALDAHEALAEGVHAEHNLHMAFIIHMFKQVMNPLQVARGMVAAWPYFPDPLAITNVLLEQQQQQHDTAAAAAAAAAVAPAGGGF